MNVLLLSAGTGSRLLPLTAKIPKCLLPVMGQPLLQRWVDESTRLKSDKVLINVHHLKDTIISYINTNYRAHSNIQFMVEPVLLGTAGSLFAAFDLDSTADILAIHTDNYSDINLQDFVSHFSLYPDSQSLIALFRTENFRNSGMIETDKQGKMVSYNHKPDSSQTEWANAGIFLFRASLLAELNQYRANLNDISKDLLPMLIGKSDTFKINGVHIDVGTELAAYQSIDETIKEMRSKEHVE